MHITEENLKKIQSQILQFENQYHRPEHSVKLMAVSKKKPIELIEQAYMCGQRVFGESYVQEAIEKKLRLNHLEGIQWHFIGPIQSNKTQNIAIHFDWVHSVDRLKIMRRLNAQRTDKQPPLNICLQVNIDKESSKSGFVAEEIMLVAQELISLPHLKLRGLMSIPKPRTGLLEQRKALSRVKALFVQLQTLSPDVDTLSMGMSGDIEAAIAEGSTMVRVGTAIFGQRKT